MKTIEMRKVGSPSCPAISACAQTMQHTQTFDYEVVVVSAVSNVSLAGGVCGDGVFPLVDLMTVKLSL